ncbi:MAG: FAD:protein FMN transferase [Candidatus Woesebacteria bacterium]|jgi:thiamine biosynthesis lipoprotein
MANVFIFDALGTHWQIETDQKNLAIQQEILSEVSRFEQNYSRFIDSSLVCRLNRNKKLYGAPKEFLEIFQYCLDMYCQTDGAFNISVCSELERLGYGKEHDFKDKISNNLSTDVLLLDRQIVMADFVKIDLGGIGKGWLIHKISEIFKVNGLYNYVINGGGDILVGASLQEVLIEHPNDATLAIGKVAIALEAIASSSNSKRVWAGSDGQAYSHIVPGRRHTQVQPDLLSVHVRSNSIKIADALATTFLLVDRKKRVQLANEFNVDFMEVRQNLTFWQTANFGFIPYN